MGCFGRKRLGQHSFPPTDRCTPGATDIPPRVQLLSTLRALSLHPGLERPGSFLCNFPYTVQLRFSTHTRRATLLSQGEHTRTQVAHAQASP